MFCPKCGTENPEGANVCSRCGCVLSSVTATVSVSKARTSGLAIASLVLGILSFCTFLLTAPLAIIFGIISLVLITKSRGQLKGTGLAVAGIAIPVVALPIVAILMAIMMPALARVRVIAYRQVCGINMAGLGKAMLLYAGDSNEVYPTPEHWCDLLIKYEDCDRKQFRCKGDREGPCSYAMNKNITKSGPNSPPDMVLLFESKPGWNQSGGPELLTMENHGGEGCNILFNDCHAAFVKPEDIRKLKWTAGP